MNKLALFEATLKRFAENGDRDAALVLELAGVIPDEPTDAKDAVGTALRKASEYGVAALTADSEWQTQSNITTSIDYITSALQHLARV